MPSNMYVFDHNPSFLHFFLSYSPLPLQSLSSPHSCTPTSSILAGPRLPRPLPYGMKPVQLMWQKEVTYDEQGNILDMVKLDPTKFPSHRYMH